jgi:hypothetical protein
MFNYFKVSNLIYNTNLERGVEAFAGRRIELGLVFERRGGIFATAAADLRHRHALHELHSRWQLISWRLNKLNWLN